MKLFLRIMQNKVNFTEKRRSELTTEHKKLTTMIDNLYLDKLQGSITERDYDRFYSHSATN